MKPDRPTPAGRLSSRAGVALVLVLAAIVLIVGLAVTLLSLSSSERKSASVFLTATETRTLAENAVGIVQAQINYATTRGTTEAWASQPGMVRTYNSAGTLDTAYKLYSAATLTQTDPAKLAEDVPTTAWTSSPALWTDLNSPVTVTVPGTTSTQSVYPILDPSVLNLQSPQQPPLGFSINNAPVGTGALANTAPMPVQWLYVLQDGSIVAPTASGTSGNMVTVAGATASNPIKGRIAFWTDDDSCKVNVNTAGAGSFWNTPHFYTTEDRKFATSQPLDGEFQRYPGHPAMTSLGAVFPGLTDQQIIGTTSNLLLTPRYLWGGSQQGTVDTYTMIGALNGGTYANGPLYADANEIDFAPRRTSSSLPSRDVDSSLSHDLVQKTGFFLTADSRAPETNLFNLPRIACWPESTNTTKGRTASDALIAFGSTVGNYPYYFQRQSSLDGTVDAGITRNQQIFAYLQNLTGQTTPGFGAKLSDKFGVDRDQILTEIWDYIRCTNLFDTRLATGYQFTADRNIANSGYGYAVPLINSPVTGNTYRGFGRSLTLAELGFIFICTADPVDTQNTTPSATGMLNSNDPTKNSTLGGTKLDSQHRRVQMMLVPGLFSPSQGDVQMAPKYARITITGLSSLQLGSQALFSADSGSMLVTDTSDSNFSFNTAWNCRALGGALDYRALLKGVSDGGRLDTGTAASGYQACPFISNFVTVPVPNPGNVNPGTMSLAAGTLTVKIETSTDNVTWGNAQVIPIKLTSATTDVPIPNLVRTGTATEASGGSNAPSTTPQYWWAFSRAGAYQYSGSSRLGGLGYNPGYFLVDSNKVAVNNVRLPGTLFRESEDDNYYTDVVRTVSPSFADFRLIAGLTSVPVNAFTQTGNWSATGAANALIHTLGVGDQEATNMPGGSQYRRHPMAPGPVGATTVYGAGGFIPPDFRSDASNAILNAVATSGDFDNGTSFWPDGAFINKPDEGNVFYGGTSSLPYFTNTDSETINSAGFFSPNRIVPGPGMFGSLPTHVMRYAADPTHPELHAWRTLLFRKQPTHPDDAKMSVGGLSGASPAVAADHLLMDLFWMPTVEPYAISEPFSTAGKVNMNYQLAPFPYIQRKTALYAVLQREKILAAPTANLNTYKANTSGTPVLGNATTVSLSQNLWTASGDGIAQTLQQFDTRFSDASGRLFLSPSELCDLWLVPAGNTLASMPTFWSNNLLTGDNERERPYTNIIPRLTTKSNTFTVHYRVQSLKLPTNLPPGTWDETKGAVAGEYRGSTTIQRFINLNDPNIATTDFAAVSPAPPTLDTFSRWRVLSARQFAP